MRLVSRMGRHFPLVRSFVRRFGTRAGYPEVSAKTAENLQDYFRRDVQELERITERDFSNWGFKR
jgi:hypothetical protein